MNFLKTAYKLQCAAVNIHRSPMIDPPQPCSPLDSNETCHGNCSILVVKPPAIRPSNNRFCVADNGSIRTSSNICTKMNIISDHIFDIISNLIGDGYNPHF